MPELTHMALLDVEEQQVYSKSVLDDSFFFLNQAVMILVDLSSLQV